MSRRSATRSRLSASRQPQPYVELYFAPPAGPVAQVVCQRRGAVVGVRFVVASHLEKSNRWPTGSRSTPPRKGQRTQRKAGSVQTFPDTPTQVNKAFALPRGTAYTVSVMLPALGQQLRAHCAGRR